MTTINELTDDHLHVILDGISHLGWANAPWDAYMGNGIDPKETEEGYLALLGEVREFVEDALTRSLALTADTSQRH